MPDASFEISKRKAISALVVALIMGGVAVGAAIWMSNDGRAPVVGAETTEQDSMRTLVVYKKNSKPEPSAPGNLMNARIVKGSVPKGGMVATVKTDEDCAPNSEGISNCLNKLRLKNGSMLEVRHPHDMSEVPCMGSGEQVQVKPA